MIDETTKFEEEVDEFEDQIPDEDNEDKAEDENKEYTVCPSCGGALFELEKVFTCENNKKDDDVCNFHIPKKILGATITIQDVKDICKNGITTNIFKMKSKKGKNFEAKLGWNKEKKETELVFVNAKKRI